jgi:hypothetical protein
MEMFIIKPNLPVVKYYLTVHSTNSSFSSTIQNGAQGPHGIFDLGEAFFYAPSGRIFCSSGNFCPGCCIHKTGNGFARQKNRVYFFVDVISDVNGFSVFGICHGANV